MLLLKAEKTDKLYFKVYLPTYLALFMTLIMIAQL
jgi:hypothetical protein